MSAVTVQKFVLLQENKVLEQFVRHRSTPAVHRQAISSALAASHLVSYLKLISCTQGCMLACGDAVTEGGCSRSLYPSEYRRVASPA